ncbi:MAG TPA: superoxide dismutase family protein [Sphingomicrobium sp.]|jgi:Cu-Zn family superoxide dismutase|nr:superoxide dismutase family protein [Sphingomicrobium sp.]
MTMRGLASLTIAAATIALAACNNQKSGAGPLADAPSVPLVNTAGQIIGEVRGGDSDNGAMLEIDAHGLPAGVHGIHIHDIGLCDPPDFKSAGPHWNPTHKQHGGQNANGAHMGDLQNVTVTADGTLKVRVEVPGTYLRNMGRNAKPGAAQILDASGAAVVIHAQPDDYKTDPSGNSGDRIACAVLGEPEAGAVVETNTASPAPTTTTAAPAATNNTAMP